MSQETDLWLNQNTLIGFTDKRGRAWHYRADKQSAEPNHYPGAIPVPDIARRLFYWQAVEGTIESNVLTADGVLHIVDKDRKAIIRPDTQTILGVFGSGYRIHDYNAWLVSNVANLLDDELQVGSAGLLKSGAVAWVQVEMPENVTGPAGFTFRPFLTAATSLDGSLSTTYNTGVQAVVCDNTLSAALGDKSHQVKIKHSSQSLGRITDARQALGIVYDVSEQFSAQVEALCAESVSDAEWRRFLDAYTPLPTETGRSRTMAANKRDTLNTLYFSDARVNPWKGTAFGVVQAVNTFTHHEQTVKGASRPERNMLRMVTGGVDALDANTLGTLRKVLVSA